VHATHKVPSMGWEGLCKQILMETVGHLMHPEQRRLEALAEGKAATVPASGGSGTVAESPAVSSAPSSSKAPAGPAGAKAKAAKPPQWMAGDWSCPRCREHVRKPADLCPKCGYAKPDILEPGFRVAPSSEFRTTQRGSGTVVTVPDSGRGCSSGSGTVPQATAVTVPASGGSAGSVTVTQPAPPQKARDAALQAPPPPEPRRAALPPSPRQPKPPPPLPEVHQEQAEWGRALPPAPRRASLPAPPPPLPKVHQEQAELRQAPPAPRAPPKQLCESAPHTRPKRPCGPVSWPLPPKRILPSDSPSEAPRPLAQPEPQSQTAKQQPGVHELSSAPQVESAQASSGAPASGGVAKPAWDSWEAECDRDDTPTSPVDPPPSPLPGSISHTVQMLSEAASFVKAAPLQPVATSVMESGASCADFEDFRTQSWSGCGGWVSEVCVGAGTS